MGCYTCARVCGRCGEGWAGGDPISSGVRRQRWKQSTTHASLQGLPALFFRWRGRGGDGGARAGLQSISGAQVRRRRARPHGGKEELGKGRRKTLDPERKGEEWRGQAEGKQVSDGGGLLDLQLPRRRAAWARGRWRHGASAMAATVERRKKNFAKTPLAQNLVIAKWSRINFSYLKRAFKHCQKFYENSHRFLIT